MTIKQRTLPRQPAYPRPYSEDASGDYPRPEYAQEGMSLRAYLAGQALTGILATYSGCPKMPD
jgi:hypothetical protein